MFLVRILFFGYKAITILLIANEILKKFLEKSFEKNYPCQNVIANVINLGLL